MRTPTVRAPSAEAALRQLEQQGRLMADIPDAALILGADERTVLRATKDGSIPGTLVGATWRVPVRWLREQVGLNGGDRDAA